MTQQPERDGEPLPGAGDDERLAHALTQLAQALLKDTSLKADLERLVRVACRLLEHCSSASVSMVVDGEPTTVAVTDRVALQLDMVQYDDDDGPCIVALGGDVVRLGFVPTDERFPHFAAGAADRRVLSVLSLPAIDHGTVVGSLNLYSRVPEGFDHKALSIGLVMAAEIAHALVKSTVLSTARSIRDQLQQHHDEKAVVSRAEGVLIALNDCSSSQARDLLRNAARHNGEPLVATAERILATMTEQDLALRTDQ